MSPRKIFTDADFPTLKNNLLLRAARNEEVERTPVWVMRQAGRYLPEFRKVRAEHDFFTICRTPSLASLITIQPIERFDKLDAAIIFSDILVVPQAMGLEVEMLPGKGPHFPEPLAHPDDMARLTPIVDIEETLGYVFDAITLTRQELQGRVPLIGFAGAPWTLMAYMIEGGGSKTLSKAKTWLMRWPDHSRALLQRITDVVVDYLIGQVQAGAQLLQVFDSWAGELSPEDFSRFSLPFLRQISERVQRGLGPARVVPMTVFAKGAHFALKELAESGYQVLSLDWTLDPQQVRRQVGDAIVLQGNLDPSVLYAEEAEVRRRTRELAERFGRRGWIANLGHGMYPDMQPEHLGWFLDQIHHF